MTLLTPPGYLQAGTYSALLDRMYVNTTTTMRSPGLTHGSRRGFFPSRVPTYSVVSGMDVAVGPCAGLITNQFVLDGGDYRFANPSNFQVTLAGSSPTLNRHDIIGIQVKDNFYDASGLNEVVPAVIQGTNSAGTPADPAYPQSFIPVCRAVVAAGATSPTLQSLIVRTTHDGGILLIASDTERANLGAPAAGTTISRTDKSGTIEHWTGAAWVTPPNPPYAHMRQTVATSIPNATWTSIVFDSAGEDLDNYAGHTGTGARYNCMRDGVYRLSGGVTWAVNGTGSRLSRWTMNSAAISGSSSPAIAGTTFFAGAAVARSILVRLVVGDFVELQGYQSSGGALNTIVGAENQSSMSVEWVAP